MTPSELTLSAAYRIGWLQHLTGGVLIVFDRLFGTYVPERKEEPCVYGLVKPVTKHDILTIELGPWIALGRDLLAARHPREALGYLFAPPGWRPQGQRETTEALRARRAAAGAPGAAACSGVPQVR